MAKKIRRGDIFYAELNPVIGSEQGGNRPVLVIQNNIGNANSPTVIVAPITSRANKGEHLPTHILIESESLHKDSFLLLEQIRTIDKQRLGEKIGHIGYKQMNTFGKGIKVSTGLINPKRTSKQRRT